MKKANSIIEGIANGIFPTGLFKRDKEGKLDKVKITSSLLSWGILISFATGLLKFEDLLTILRFLYE